MGVVALTIHDSILCFPEDVDRVSNVIRTSCYTLYGLTPHLKYANMPVQLEDDEPCPPMTEDEKINLKNLMEGL